MSYQVLARKWRPQNFKQMVGQEHVLRALMNALDSDRLHHAYLFTGTRGVGKTTIARILAKCLNCETGITSTPCGECNSCKEIAAGNFLDLIEVDAASRTKVEDTRELLENVQYAPTRARFKVYLIDEVHMLTGHSFNALLKTLEEPPPHVKFLFATTDPQKLPATILSRCLQFNLKRMPVDMISGHLDYLLNQESISFNADALRLLARAADGSMRDALSLLDQSIAFSGADITEASVRDMLGTISHEPLIDLLELIIAGDGAGLLKQVDDLSSVTPDFEVATDALIMLLHQLAVQQVVPESINEEPRVAELASKITKEEVQLFYQIALQGRRDLSLSPDPRSGFEMLLLRMLSFRPLREGMELEQSKLPQTAQETDSSKKKTVISEGKIESLKDPKTAIEEHKNPANQNTSENTDSSNKLNNDLNNDQSANKFSKTPSKPQLQPQSNVSSAVPPWEDIPPFLEAGYAEAASTDSSVKDPIETNTSQVSSNQNFASNSETYQDRTDHANSTQEKSNDIINPVSGSSNQKLNKSSSESLVSPVESIHDVDVNVNHQSNSNDNIEDLLLQTTHEYGLEEAQADMEQDALISENVDPQQPWHQIVPQLNLSGRANELIKHCLVASHENGIISLLLNKDSEGLLAETTHQEIQTALINLFGNNTRLELKVAEAPAHSDALDKNLETPAQRNTRKITETQQQAQNNIESDPFVIELKNRFGAQLVPGSVQPKSS